MKYILIIIATLRGPTPGTVSVATAEFDDKDACYAAREAIAQEFVIKQTHPGVLLATGSCLAKANVAKK